MIRVVSSILSLLLLAQADPRVEALREIHEGVLRAHVGYLADDALEGRAAGFPGNEKAVDYLVREVTSYGLVPAGEAGRFTQEFVTAAGRRAKNVIALLEGSDPDRRGEYVALGAHLDHVGRKGQAVGGQVGETREGDDIWNGADDNASGTSAVLAAAKAFSRLRARPKRSVLFCWWNAEESGLEGSRHWVRQPTRPLEKVVYYLNLDMVGRNPDRPMDLEGVKNAEGEALERILTEACRAEELAFTKYDHYHEAMFRSDGASFLWAGIPASMFFTSWHADYHRVGDHADKIAYGNLAKVARAAFRVAYEVADLPEAPRINVDTPLRGRPLRIRAEDARVGDSGACRVTEVAGEGVLGRAGLRPGDWVVSFRGQALPAARPVAELWRRVQAAPADRELELEVMRNGERHTLKVVWPSR
jgi:hypothetical protein